MWRNICGFSIVSTCTIHFLEQADSSSLKTSLSELGLKCDPNPSWESCDIEYKTLQDRLRQFSHVDLVQKSIVNDPIIILTGAVLTEAISAAYWSDALLVLSTVWNLCYSTSANCSSVLPISDQNGRSTSKILRNLSSKWTWI